MSLLESSTSKQRKMKTEQIWEEFSDKLYRFILAKVNDKELAKDLLQEVFIKIHSNIDSLDNADVLSSWLFTITRNTVYDYYRSKKAYKKEKKQLELDGFGFEDDEINSLCETCLYLFLEELPEKYREAIIHTDLGELSQKEYAEEIGISYSGLKSRVQRGREQLNIHFKECCFVENNSGESACKNKDEFACTC